MFGNVYSGKRVFITGHTGFKGSWLAAWIEMLGARVTGFALPPAYPRGLFELLGLKNRLRHVEGDIRNLVALQQAMRKAKPDFVFHLAAQALVRDSYADPKTTFDTNVGGSVNLLEAVRACPSVRTLVYTTSDKCYRNEERLRAYREGDPLGGDDPYSASKGCAELVFRSYRLSFLDQRPNFNAAATRSGNVIGGGDWARDRLIPDCFRALYRKKPVVVRNPDATRPWQHVLDPLGGYLLLGARLYRSREKFVPCEFNFGPVANAHRTVREVVKCIVREWGSGTMAIRRPANAPREATLLHLNCDRAHRRLGWRPTWSFDQAVRQTVRWYRAHADGRDVAELTRSQIEQFMREWKGGTL
jgi:CDP-glucose 4,6-dehydratase